LSESVAPVASTSRAVSTPCEAVLVSESDPQPIPFAARIYGSRFSKSPEEREKMLGRRKEDLMKAARQSYAFKQRQALPSPSSLADASSKSALSDESKET